MKWSELQSKNAELNDWEFFFQATQVEILFASSNWVLYLGLANHKRALMSGAYR